MLKRIGSSYLSLFIELPILILMGLGTVFVFSAGANVSGSFDFQEFYKFTTLKQLMFFPLAILIMYGVACIDSSRFSFTRAGALRSFTPYLLAISIALLIIVLIPGVGVVKNQARRWLSISIGPAAISFQPSELAKWSLVIFMAAAIDHCASGIKKYWKRFLPICLVPAALTALIITQDFGTAAFISLLAFLMLVVGGATWWHFLTPLPIIAPAFYFAIATSPYRIERLKAFFVPEVESSATYHAVQSLIAISTGGIWGKGLGRGVSKYDHLPEDTTDFIFAIIGEELGFVGAGFVVVLFILLTAVTLVVINRCRNRFNKILATGITMTIALQAAINIGVVTSLLPTKGIPLPFLSAGGTSLLLTAAAAGILINIARQTEDLKECSHKPCVMEIRDELLANNI